MEQRNRELPQRSRSQVFRARTESLPGQGQHTGATCPVPSCIILPLLYLETQFQGPQLLEGGASVVK